MTQLRRVIGKGAPGASPASAHGDCPRPRIPHESSGAALPGAAPKPLVLVLPLCPSTNALFANRKGGRRKSDAYTAWLADALEATLQQGTWAFSGSVKVHIGLPLNMRGDIDNRSKATLDWLVTRGVIEDDRHVRELSIKRQMVEPEMMVVSVETA